MSAAPGHRMAAPLETTATSRLSLQRKCACGGQKDDCPDCKKPLLQRRAIGGGDRAPRGGVPPIVHNVLRGPGTPLDPATRTDMEARFGHDFARVRVHADETAARSARSVDALAYTVGQHIVFGAGQYAPCTATGRRLLAHELTHTVQQCGAFSSHGDLSVSIPGDEYEQEAERGERAIAQDRAFESTMIAPAAVARQPVPDAGGAGGGAPAGPGGPPAPGAPAGGASPAGPGAPAGAAPAPAVPPVVRSVEVENQRTAITYRVPSNLGAGGRTHWVTIAGTRPDIIVRANLDPAVPATDPAAAGLVWESDPAGEVAAGADALHGTVSVPTARRTVVRARLGASRAETTIWAVFVSVRVAGGPAMVPPARAAGQLTLDSTVNFTGTIHPASIITAADRPALDGANTTPPPGGTNVCGGALAGGVDHRWDMSRQRRLRHVDPAGVVPAVIATRNAAGGRGCVHNVSVYPAPIEIGNDDAGVGDENNDPYANGGVITSQDSPTRIYPDTVGADGDTIESHLQFREFARLEFNRTWWKVSHFVPWRIHFRVIRAAGQWQDNGSDAGADNAGF